MEATTIDTTRPRLRMPGGSGAALSLLAWRDPRVRAVSIALGAWATFWVAVSAPHGMYSWHYFATGAHILRSPDAAHVFAAHPELQMGPLTLVVAALITPAGGAAGVIVAAATMMLLGVLVLAMLVHVFPLAHGVERLARLLVVGALLTPAWTVLAVHYGHLDDALALTATVAATLAMTRSRPWLVAVLLAVATGCKPWAAPFAVVLLARPRAARHLALFLALVAVPWVFFVVRDPATLNITSFAIDVAPDSALRAFGVSAASTPAWDRPLQLTLGVALGLWLVRRGRAYAVPFVVLAVRMLLDPGTYPYYTTGLVVAALLLDITGRDHRLLPRHTVGVVLWLAAGASLNAMSLPATAGYLRAAYLVASVVLVLVGGRRGAPSPRAPAQRGDTRDDQPRVRTPVMAG